MRRVIVYIDGHNLYYGIRAKFGRRFHWLDLQALAESLIPPNHHIRRVDYFTARIRSGEHSARRQAAYLAAIAGHCPKVRVVEGRFQQRLERCQSCGARRYTYDEKETDVNIAAAIVSDAARDGFDTALLLSADADLSPAIVTARGLTTGKRFYAAFPPRRRSDVLARTADAAFTIGDAKVRRSQLPDKVILSNGLVIERPPYWR